MKNIIRISNVLKNCFVFFLLIVLIHLISCRELCSEQSEPNLKNPDQDQATLAWYDIEDKLAIDALESFIAKYPNAKQMNDAKLYIALSRQLTSIKGKKTPKIYFIPWNKLPDIWKQWRRNYSFRSITIFQGEALALPDGFSARFDAAGQPVLPSKEGSILIFEPSTPNTRFTDVGEILLGGIIIEAKSKDRIYFGISDKLGLVHLRGECKVIMPDGSSKVLK
jgi:hypothetical protein